MNRSDFLLSQFEPDIAAALLDFCRHIAKLDVDVLVFMARKSYCLYKILLQAGAPKPNACIVSDRILDMDLSRLAGKRIALIDDTLIVGTTLARTKRAIESNVGAAVTVHTFCVDREWHCKDLIVPDSVGIEMENGRVLSFCAAEVRALSLAPRPYMVDFPLTRTVRIGKLDSPALLSSVEWDCYHLSTEMQERNDVRVFTFCPTQPILDELSRGIGDDVMSCIDIAKVRGYGRLRDDALAIQLVPMVTLKPLRADDVDALFHMLLDRLSAHSFVDLSAIRNYACSHRAKQRLAQYFLSAALGQRFVVSVGATISRSIEGAYDQRETDHHYGPWLRDEMSEVNRSAQAAIWHEQTNSIARRSPATLAPARLQEAAWDAEVLSYLAESTVTPTDPPERINNDQVGLVNSFCEIFLNMYERLEVPARREAKQCGAKLLDTLCADSPHRDRLDKGIPWGAIVDHLARKYSLPVVRHTEGAVSLVLDICNDLGIAVPITCEADGVIYRAYRHGEDVLFSDQEVALSYDMLSGITETAGRPEIPHLSLEKALVIMMRVGSRSGFLQPLYGTSGDEGIGKISFNLKGAVPMLHRGPAHAGDSDIWLSEYLQRRGVLRTGGGGSGRLYLLGSQIENCVYLNANASPAAYELGSILGLLLKWGGDQQHQGAPLNDEALILLATCTTPRDTAAAVQTELGIYRKWLEEKGQRLFTSLQWDNRDRVIACLKELLSSSAHEALHSARMKYVGYATGKPLEIVRRCEEFLGTQYAMPMLPRRWRSYWEHLTSSDYVAQRKVFDPWLHKAMEQVVEMTTCMSAVEIALRAKLIQYREDIGGEAYNDSGAPSTDTDDQNESGEKLFRRLSSRHGLNHAITKYSELIEDIEMVGLTSTPFMSRADSVFFSKVMEGKVSFNHSTVFEEMTKRMMTQMGDVAATASAIQPEVEMYGKRMGCKEYKYMLYYDVINSKGSKGTPSGISTERYRACVQAFKGAVGGLIHRFSIEAKKRSCEVFCANDKYFSMDDAKHIFFAGSFARREVATLAYQLLSLTSPSQGLGIRLFLIACDFVGTDVYRLDGRTEVAGELFWEHWSCLLPNCRSLESDMSLGDSLLIATDGLQAGLKTPAGMQMRQLRPQRIETSTEGFSRFTRVHPFIIR